MIYNFVLYKFFYLKSFRVHKCSFKLYIVIGIPTNLQFIFSYGSFMSEIFNTRLLNVNIKDSIIYIHRVSV